MVLDLIFVKGIARGATPADVELSNLTGAESYKDLAGVIFSRVEWAENGDGFARIGDVTAKIDVSDSALKVTLDGDHDLSGYVMKAAAVARSLGVVTIDVNGFAVLEG